MQSYSAVRRIGIGILLFLLFGLIAVATRCDLAISQALYLPDNRFAVFMEAFGWWSLYLPSLVWGGFLLRRNGHPLLGLAITVGFSCALWIPALSTLEKRGWLLEFPVWAKAILILITCVASFWFAGIPGRRTTMRLSLLCCAGFWMMAANNLIIQGLKLLWRRSRFDEMLVQGSFENFTPWFQPFGNGGSSFPSGHTAAAASVLLLLLAADIFPLVKRHPWLYSGFCVLYIGGMAVSRVVIGRHFLSDTVASVLVVWALFVVVRHSKLWKAALNQLHDRLTAL